MSLNVVAPQSNMQPASNLLHPLVSTESTLNRKRYLEDLEVLGDSSSNKKSRTAPSSPPLGQVFQRRSSSPDERPDGALLLTLSPLQAKPALITPTSPSTTLAQPVHIDRLDPKVGASSSSAKDPAQTTLPSFKYLTQNDRYSTGSHHALEYPDTCVNDDDWRLNLEVWIEKNFPEKFNNLKNLLRYDKPGFDLLNGAILLTELKEQWEHARASALKPNFTPQISKKMIPSASGYHRSFSDNEEVAPQFASYTMASQIHGSSPISAQSRMNTAPFPFETNYTYSTHTPPTSPISKHATSTSILKHSSKSPKSQQSNRQWNGHHKLNQSVVLQTNNFIHTQNHKGPNHTYTIHHHNPSKRHCISCGSDQSPCWRPSWSSAAGQLCNSCGLRYKKTGARCTEKNCLRIPAKGEWTAMKARGKLAVHRPDGSVDDVYQCLHCGGEVEAREKAE